MKKINYLGRIKQKNNFFFNGSVDEVIDEEFRIEFSNFKFQLEQNFCSPKNYNDCSFVCSKSVPVENQIRKAIKIARSLTKLVTAVLKIVWGLKHNFSSH